MPQLAFFPWLELEDDIDIGGYSLKRFKPGSLPRVDEGLRATLDFVLAPYRDTSDNPVESAVILNRNGRGLIDDLSEEDRDDLFRFAELFAFAALAAREFFISAYFNRDHLRLIVQAFSDPRGGAVVETRRKDGVTRDLVPGAIYRVQMPWHVTNPGLPIKPDWALLRALLASREREDWSTLYRGIVLFNQANTDAPDISPDTELVLSYAAMEQVLGISSRSDRKQFPREVGRGMAPEPRGAAERMASATDRSDMAEGKTTPGLLGGRLKGLSRELGARQGRERAASAVDCSPTPAVDCLHRAQARQAGLVKDGSL